MTSPLPFPDWVPAWVQLVTLILGIMLGLAFLLMPFSVFGVKSRLESVEARLDEIQGEIRALALRLREPAEPSLQAPPPRAAEPRPPIPPAAWAPETAPRRPIGSAPDTTGYRPRLEPRIDRGR